MSVLKQRKKRLADLAARVGKQEGPVSAELKATIVRMVSEGATLTYICELPDMPCRASIYRARDTDKDFDAAMRAAMVKHAETLMDMSAEYTADAIEHADLDMSKRADILHRITTSRAEKLAPREYGVMVKHADADGGKLTVAVINYATPTPEVPKD
jgi:hypothetical protein